MKIKKIFSLLLVCALFIGFVQFTATATGIDAYAGNMYYRGEGTPIVSYESSYKGISVLVVGDGFQASTEIFFLEDIPSIPPVYTKYLAYQARLYSPSGLVASSRIEKSTSTNLPTVTTTTWHGERAYSCGWVEYKSTNGTSHTMSLNSSPMQSKNRTIVQDTVLESLKASLVNNCQYPVNQYGESYGSALLLEIVGEEPDLISAVGMNGISGYVRAEELEFDYDAPSEEDVIIPVYDLNGIAVDSFVLHGRDENA